MEQFINFYCKVEGKLIMSQELAETLASLCLPLFFTDDYPKEKYSWDVVEEYAPFIFLLKKQNVNNCIYKYLKENHPEAWFKDMFNNSFIAKRIKENEKPKVLVDFDLIKSIANILEKNPQITYDSAFKVPDNAINNLKLFFNKLSQSSSFAHKAHKELKKINS